ncbi:SPAS2 protein, partial [Polypterus senegalus]
MVMWTSSLQSINVGTAQCFDRVEVVQIPTTENRKKSSRESRGSAVEILKEWNVTGKKKTRKKKPKPKPPTPANDGLVEPSQTNTEGTQSVTSSEKEGLNGFHANGSLNDMESVDSLSEQLDSISVDHHELEDSESATPEVSDPTEQEEGPCTVEPHGQQTTSVTSQGSKPQRSSNTRSRQSSHPVSSPLLVMPDDLLLGSSGSKKLVYRFMNLSGYFSFLLIASNIDKSVKDLQRCMASLTRYRVVVKEEMDSSIKRMKQIFAELQTCLMDREVALLGEMDKVKAEALAILNGRQKKAEELRRLTDKVGTMSEEQLSELRADIKHFVSERKYDEELGRAVKFTYKLEPVKEAIVGFGQVYHPNTSYSSRSRCSSASSTSLTSPSIPELHPQPTPAPQGLGYSPRSAGPRSEHNQRQVLCIEHGCDFKIVWPNALEYQWCLHLSQFDRATKATGDQVKATSPAVHGLVARITRAVPITRTGLATASLVKPTTVLPTELQCLHPNQISPMGSHHVLSKQTVPPLTPEILLLDLSAAAAPSLLFPPQPVSLLVLSREK